MPTENMQISPMNKVKVLISGASIAGLTLAYWLKRYGFAVTVVEIGTGPRKGGAPIDIRGLALGVAERMGILSQIQAARVYTKGMIFVNDKGKTVGSMNPALFDENPGIDIELRRDDLVNILYSVAKEGVEYLFEDTIKTLNQDDDGVEVTFGSGEARRFDLVVGADGLHSAVRQLAFGKEAGFVHHLGMYVALAEIPQDIGGRENWVMFYNAPGKMAGIPRYSDQAFAMFVFRSPELNYDYHDINQKKKILLDAFANESAWEVPKLREAVKHADDMYFDSVSQVRMPSWWQGRVAVIGDAAHCAAFLSGMGSTLAMVGAAKLADELVTANGDYRQAFSSYEKALRQIVEPIQARVPQAGSIFVPSTNLGIWLRNQLTCLLTFLFTIRSWTRRASSSA